MQFQLTTDYAIRIMEYLCTHINELATAGDMSRYLGITYQYLMKVLARLKETGLIRSAQGRNGGYLLARMTSDITLYDVVTAMEGDIVLNRCLAPDGFCSRNAAKTCSVRKVFALMEADITAALKNRRLSDLWP